MLYERWLEVAASHPDALAVYDGATGQAWTFSDLAAAGERQEKTAGRIQFANGSGRDFILSVLTGWRDGKVVVPLEVGQRSPEAPKIPDPNIVHLKTTSATTGAPRLIAFTADQLMADCDQVVRTMGLNPRLPNVGAITLAHSYGFSNLVLPLLLKGIPLRLTASALPESVRAAMADVPAVALPAVPALWQAWWDAGIISPQIKIAISAGAPLPLPLEIRVFESSGVKIHNFYGSSECGGIAYDQTHVPRPTASLAGTPLDGVRLSKNDEGCITVRSRAVASGYWPDPDPTLNNGLFQTGDLGELTDGVVYLQGRACDRINVAGRKVIPEAVERALCEHPAVNDCLVFGVPSETPRNETIVACVAADRVVTPRELADFAQSLLPSWQVPREWWVLDSLGANERGKRSRALWRERYFKECSVAHNT